jgi:hypothetical protein
MAKKRDYSDFISYAQSHMNMTENQVIESFRKTGGSVQKQNGLSVLREAFGFEKGEKRGQTLQQKLDEKRAKEYIPPSITPKKDKTKKPKEQTTNKREFFITDINSKSQSKHVSRKSDLVRKLENNIRELYQTDSDSFLKISLSIQDDGYTRLNNFSVMIPFNGKKKQGIKNIGKDIIKNLKTYYDNLAKRYGNKQELSYDMISALTDLNKNLTNSKGLKKNDLKMLFKSKGIDIGEISILTFEDN